MGKWKATKIGKILNRRLLTSFFYKEKNHDINKSILIAGTGRSGTTWLAEILSNYLKYRIIFEPFNPRKVSLCKDFLNKQYIPPDSQNKEFYKIFNKTFSGKIRGRWINQDNRFFRPDGRIIKSIRTSFFLGWFKLNFPQIPIIYILRHPCAVAVSRARLGWTTDDLDLILKQKELMNDHLQPYKPLIAGAKTIVERNACIWAVENFMALKQLNSGDAAVITYEDLHSSPEKVLQKISTYLGVDLEFKGDSLRNNPSLTVKSHSNIMQNQDLLSTWKNALTDQEITKVMDIVKKFSLDTIYDISIMPKKENFL